MDGQAVFKLAVSLLDKTARAVLEKAGKTAADVDWLIPHQANLRIMQGTARKLGLPPEKIIVTLQEHGNTSAASIPLALDHAVRSGQARPLPSDQRPSVEQAHPLRAAPILGQPLRRDPGHDHTENRQCEPMSTRNSTDLGEGEPRGRSDPLQYPYHAMLMSRTSLLSNTHASDNPPTTSTSPSRTLRNMLKFA